LGVPNPPRYSIVSHYRKGSNTLSPPVASEKWSVTQLVGNLKEPPSAFQDRLRGPCWTYWQTLPQTPLNSLPSPVAILGKKSAIVNLSFFCGSGNREPHQRTSPRRKVFPPDFCVGGRYILPLLTLGGGERSPGGSFQQNLPNVKQTAATEPP